MAPPVPIPNTEVKRLSADDTAPARMWENRSLPRGLPFFTDEMSGFANRLCVYLEQLIRRESAQFAVSYYVLANGMGIRINKKGSCMTIRNSLLVMLIVAGVLALVACQQQADSSAELADAQAALVAAETRIAGLEQELSDAQASGGAMMESGDRLAAVKERGKVICASRNDVPGYGSLDNNNNNVGFDIDLCRALAAAVLGDPNAIEIRLISAAERGPTIQSGEVDMLVRTVTWTTSRDAQWGNYAQTMFYDGQGFLVNKSLGVSSALELKDATVCVTQGTTTELNLQDFSNQNGLNITPLTFEDTDAVVAAYQSEQCDAFTNDRSQLAAISSAFANKNDHVILPETISEEPLGPVVPHGDDQWFDVVKTVMAILIYGEAYGLTSGNMNAGDNTAAKRLLGDEGSFGQESLGLSQTVARDVLGAVGNYGEIYDRNLGPAGINLPREGGRNALWADAPCADCPKGGQIYAAPPR